MIKSEKDALETQFQESNIFFMNPMEVNFIIAEGIKQTAWSPLTIHIGIKGFNFRTLNVVTVSNVRPLESL